MNYWDKISISFKKINISKLKLCNYHCEKIHMELPPKSQFRDIANKYIGNLSVISYDIYPHINVEGRQYITA